MPLPCPFVTFASFCSNFFAYFCPPTLKPLWGDHAATPAPNVTRSNGNMSKDHRGMPVPCPFCYLCFLLFKFLCLLLSADLEAALGRPPYDTCVQRYTIKREFDEGPSRNADPVPFVTFASFCSNFFCLLLSADLEAALGRPPCDTCRPTSHDQTGICRRIIAECQSLAPLLPLLPSLQISLLTSVRRQRPFVSRQKDIEEICTTAFSRKVVGG
jgi:hypothetical protein